MSEFDAIFDGMQQSKPLSSRLPKIPEGSHVLILKSYQPKRSTKPGHSEVHVEASFMLEETNTSAKPGDAFEWAWFVNSPGFHGEKEMSRGQAFIRTVGDTLGDGRESKAIGADLMAGRYRGMRLRATVTPAYDNKTGQLAKGKKGHQIYNIEWAVVPGQTADMIAQMRAALDQIDPPKTPAVAQAAAQTAAPAPQYAAPVAPPPPAYAQPYAPPVAQPAPAQSSGQSSVLPAFLANLPKAGQ